MAKKYVYVVEGPSSLIWHADRYELVRQTGRDVVVRRGGHETRIQKKGLGRLCFFGEDELWAAWRAHLRKEREQADRYMAILREQEDLLRPDWKKNRLHPVPPDKPDWADKPIKL